MNRVHPNCTERPSLNKECGWKGGDRSGLAQGQELTGRKRKTKTSLQERKKRKTYLTLTGLLMEGLERIRGDCSLVAPLNIVGVRENAAPVGTVGLHEPKGIRRRHGNVKDDFAGRRRHWEPDRVECYLHIFASGGVDF